MNKSKKKTEQTLEKEEKGEKGRGRDGAITVLDCLIFEINNDISNNDPYGCKRHIYEMNKVMEDIKGKDWYIPDDIIKFYNKIKEKYSEIKQ